MNKVSRDRLAGVIIGQCVGDAIGFPVEGMPEETCVDFVDRYLFVMASDIPARGYKPGQYTDDSQLARELLINLVKNNGFDPEMYVEQIIELFSTNKVVGRGISTHHAYERLASGIPWYEAGEPGPMAGNGTAMRAAPVGMMYYDDMDKLVEIAIQQGVITHTDEKTKAGSIVIAAGVGYLLLNEELDINLFLNQIAGLIRPHSDIFANLVLLVEHWLDVPYSEALYQISISGNPISDSKWNKISPFVIPSVIWSLYSFLKTPDNYWETIKTAIKCGGDVDTTAAMAGALSGAYNGLSKIPKEYRDWVHDEGQWNEDNLLDLVDKLIRLKMDVYKLDTKLHVLKTELDNIMQRWKYDDVDQFLHDSKHGMIKEAEEDAITVTHLIDQINELNTTKSSWN